MNEMSIEQALHCVDLLASAAPPIERALAAGIRDLRDERDQALIRAEAAEAELEAIRRTERVQERRAS